MKLKVGIRFLSFICFINLFISMINGWNRWRRSDAARTSAQSVFDLYGSYSLYWKKYLLILSLEYPYGSQIQLLGNFLPRRHVLLNRLKVCSKNLASFSFFSGNFSKFCSLYWDLNSKFRSIRRARWPLYQHNRGPFIVT